MKDVVTLVNQRVQDLVNRPSKPGVKGDPVQLVAALVAQRVQARNGTGSQAMITQHPKKLK